MPGSRHRLALWKCCSLLCPIPISTARSTRLANTGRLPLPVPGATCAPQIHTLQGSSGNLMEMQQAQAQLCLKPFKVPTRPCALGGGFLLTFCHLLPHPLLKMNSSPAETLGPPNIQLCPGTSHSFPCPENAQDPQSREMLASMQLCPGGCWGLGVPAFWLFSPLSPKHAGRVECAEWDPQLGAAGTCWAHPEAGWEWERVPPTPRWPHYPF